MSQPPGFFNAVPLIERLLCRLTDRLPCRIIDGEQGEPYLERYYVAGLFGWHTYLHRFVDSDPDRGLHDHPWGRAISLVLTGGYDELRFAHAPQDADTATPITEPPLRRRHVRPWRLNLLRGTDYHRVVLRGGRPAWTLFLHGPRVKGWGFRRAGRYRAMARSGADFRHRNWWQTAPSGRAVRESRAAGAGAQTPLTAQQR
ncbi:hypothetical protein CKO31_10045 [Thiohalocapsa halophila]|uniref:Cysteine dioxygenase n=1 Tax=Thiohalocapsa halophila TaxID=69359 RepID=A0ABS1CGU4_9GAMM|nr:hypothetical protein [Thiohalocapsa halophila]